MQRLHEWFRKHKAKVLIPILLCLVTVPLALTACGSASSEDTERPKTPFELESEIQSLQADDEAIKGDTAWLRSAIVTLQGTAAKDWTADIYSLISRLNAIEAKFNTSPTPTPTATSQGGWPVPTATATQVQQVGTGIHATLLQDSIRNGDAYDFDIDISAGSTTLSKYVVLELMPTTTNKPDIASASFLWSGVEAFDVSESPGLNDCQLVRIISKSKVLVPQGATYTYSAIFDFDYQSSVTPVGWTYNWYLTDTP